MSERVARIIAAELNGLDSSDQTLSNWLATGGAVRLAGLIDNPTSEADQKDTTLSTERLREMRAHYGSSAYIGGQDVVSLIDELLSRRSTDEEAVAWRVDRFGNGDEFIGSEVYLTKPDIRSSCRTDFIPLYTHPIPIEPVAVKGLEWDFNRGFAAETAFGLYEVEPQGAVWHLLQGGGHLSSHPTEAKAKSAAQADFDQRIRSALTSP